MESKTEPSLPSCGPIPVPDGQRKVARHIVGRTPSVVEHRGGPSEPRDQLESQARVSRDGGIIEGEHERSYRATVHLLVWPVAAVDPDYTGVVADRVRVRGWAAELLSPVRGKPLGVLRVNSAFERMSQNGVGQATFVPRVGECEQGLSSTHRLEDRALH